MPNKPVYEMIGKRFGSRVVIDRAENSKSGHVRWICKCDCGAIHEVDGGSLRNDGVQKCRSCAAKSRPPGHGKTVRYLLHNAKARSKKLGLPCTITLDDIKVPDYCPLLGIQIKTNNTAVDDYSPSLDRIIPELGYIPQNIIVVSFRANTIKQNATPSELRMIADRLEQLLKERNLC